MNARQALIFDVNGGMSVAEAAQKHGVARSCAYKWIGRYSEEGLDGLTERSRRPELSPQRKPQDVVDALVGLKRKHPDFGPAKLVTMLDVIRGEHVMSASTAGEILARLGMVEQRRNRHRSPGPPERMPYTIAGAGDAMTTDFKGQFRTRDSRLCYPLTIADPFSRYVLAITALPSTHGPLARQVFERVFREYGVPRLIISDNGSPFASAASLGGLTQLSRWWIELGSTPARIEPGRPQQNGIHERMHRTFKKSLQRQSPVTFAQQQRRFDLFRTEFNEVRPHQSLGQKPPATVFRPYRPYARPTPFDYDRNMEVRRVNEHGAIKWQGREMFVSEVLIGAAIALLPVSETLYAIDFRHVRIGWLDMLAWRAVSRRPEPPPTPK